MKTEKNRYLSILKQKAGELAAVRELADGVWDRWNPLFELLTDEEDGNVIKDNVIATISKACCAGAMVFLDFDGIGFLTSNHIEEILIALDQAGLIPVPVVTLSSEASQLTAFRTFIATRGRKVAIRIFFSDVDATVTAHINAAIQSVSCDVSVSHLIFDLEEINSDYLSVLNVAFPAVAGQLPHLNTWATVTVAGTGFPKVLQVEGNTNDLIRRTEWGLFNNTRAQLAPKVKRLDFGDYTVSHPVIIEFDPKKMQISPKIIYTTTNDWLAYKGKSAKKHGFAQTHAMCQALVKRPEFVGAGFSAGDQYIFDCAQGTATQGNPQTWKRVGTNHHITFVADQVAKTL